MQLCNLDQSALVLGKSLTSINAALTNWILTSAYF